MYPKKTSYSNTFGTIDGVTCSSVIKGTAGSCIQSNDPNGFAFWGHFEDIQVQPNENLECELGNKTNSGTFQKRLYMKFVILNSCSFSIE